MPLSMMQPLSRPPSRDITPPSPRRLSRTETFQLAETARRKSSDRVVSEDLRLKLSHVHLLDMLLQDIARGERELQTSPTEEKYLTTAERQSKSPVDSTRTTSRIEEQYDEYGFPLDEEEAEEDFGGLALMRTESRRPVR